jgi:threonylcarbamoyladenosine tRNA methylthiotransferase MtaB
MVLGNREKAGLADLVASMNSGLTPLSDLESGTAGNGFLPVSLWGEGQGGGQPDDGIAVDRLGEEFYPWPVTPLPGHTRARLKIQDGCNHRCTYCIVPQVRGGSRSLALGRVAGALRELAAGGYQEVVLTGVDLGQYGKDLDPPATLAALLNQVRSGCVSNTAESTANLLVEPSSFTQNRQPKTENDLTGRAWPFRVRISSLEPQEVTPELLEACAGLPGFCPHFHLPLQSGAAPVLKAMGRPYTPGDFRELVHYIRRGFPDASLGLDVLVGFPGETASDFEATRDLVASLPATYLHVFPFSPRPGTPAALMPRVAAGEVRDRARVMRELGRLKKQQFLQSQIGKVREVLVEGPASELGWLQGLSDNYLRVVFPGPPAWRNQRIWVRLGRVQGEVLTGEAKIFFM